MNQTLEQLIKLQEIDHRLLEIKELMGDLPSTVESQEEELSILENDNSVKEVRIDEIDKESRHLEREIDNINSKMKTHKDQLYLVKTNKEYDSLNNEIDHMKTNISEFEENLINVVDEKEKLEESIKLNSGKIETIFELLSTNKVELNLAMAETKNEKSELEKNRSVLYDNIEPIKLNAYETIKNNRDGAGMESIIGKACGGCYSQLPPQTIIEIKKNINILNCPSCSIMLFWDGTEE